MHFDCDKKNNRVQIIKMWDINSQHFRIESIKCHILKPRNNSTLINNSDKKSFKFQLVSESHNLDQRKKNIGLD